MQFLQQNEINLQKDQGILKDRVREVQLQQSSLNNEIQQKITNFDTYYKQTSINLKKQIKDDRDEVRARLEKLKLEYTPKLNLIEDYGQRLTTLSEYSSSSESKFTVINAEFKRLWQTVFGYGDMKEKVTKIGSMINRVNVKQSEMENIWMFFQRFVDEQGHDYLKVIRGPSYSLIEKLNGVEWLARYSEFITPDTCILASNYFRDMFNRGRKLNPIAEKFIRYEHSSEAIPTIFSKLRTKEQEFSTGNITFEMWDEAATQVVILLQSIVLNIENARMVVKVDGSETLIILLLAQRTIDDKAGGKDGSKVDDKGQTTLAESDHKTLNFVGKIKQEQWLTPNNQVLLMDVHLPLIRTIANFTTDMNAVEDITRDKRFGFKIMKLLAYSSNQEVHFECMKILKNIT